MANLEQLKEDLGVAAYDISPAEAKKLGICIDCKEPALPKCYSGAGRAEYAISGLCEVCFDKLFEY